MSLTGHPVAPAAPNADPAQTIAPYLAVPDDIIRCAAARALGALGGEDAAAQLVDVLMDPDPDLRADAMTALARCARPEDAPAIRRSLAGDPVGEVKLVAIQALARLKDAFSVPLLRALARSRCEAEIAWEVTDGGWDEWLDVQVAAIQALGAIGAEDAVEDLIEIRADETGQNLDHVVFAALARMPERGVPALRDFLEYSDARVRERALAALSTAGREALTPPREALVRDPSPRVRLLAIDCFGEEDETLAALALEDPDVGVRCRALARIAPLRPDILRRALFDPDEQMRAVALEAGARQSIDADEPDLVANVEAWLRTAGVPLATVCAAVLPALAGPQSVKALDEAASDGERHLEVRIAALRSLGGVGTEESVDALRRAAVDRTRQVRLAALAALAELSRSAPGDIGDQARAVLTDAVRGSLAPEPPADASTGNAGPPAAMAVEHEESGSGSVVPEAEAPATPTPTPSASASGDTASTTNSTEPAYPRSTLEAIGGRPVAAARSEAAPVPSDDHARSSGRAPKTRPGRTALEGPEDIGQDLRLTALRLAAACDGDGIDEALAKAAEEATPTLRAAALEAIAQRAATMSLSPDLTDLAVGALQDGDPPVRAAAARTLAARGDAHRLLAPLLDDPDDRVRAAALKAVAAAHPEMAAGGCRDSSPVVRGTALDALSGCEQGALVEQAMRAIVDGGFADTLGQACRRHPVALHFLLGMLRQADTLSRQGLLMILEAMGQAFDAKQDVPVEDEGELVKPAS